MAEYDHFYGEEELNKSWSIRARQFSDASTALPSSPASSPPMSRMVSPRNMGMVMEEIGDSLAFEFTGLPDEVSNDLGFHGLPDEISNAVLPTVSIAQSAALVRKTSTPSSTGWMVLLPTFFGLILCGLLHLGVFRISMGIVTVLMLLPGLYLYVVDGCRPEDFDGEVARRQRKGAALTLVLASLSLASFYCAYISLFFRVFMWTFASLMLLPGIYLYAIDGCRPEDYEEKVGGSSIGPLVLSLLGVGSCYGMYVSLIFRACMGTMATLMLLPGLCLYIIDGCRPEDYEEGVGGSCIGPLVLSLVGVGSCYGMCVSSIFCACMGTMATLMLSPGLYLYIIDGCRPEDYEEAVGVSCIGPLVLSLLGVGSSYGMYVPAIFRACMGTMATLMLLPGLYLYIIDGCRPEDYEEGVGGSSIGPLVLSLLGVGSCYGMYISLIFRVCMGTVAALMLLPGLYLYIIDGCRPEDYDEEGNDGWSSVGALVLTLVSLGLYISTVFRIFMGVVAAVMFLPGLYLYVVDGCRPEDGTEEFGIKEE